MMHEDNANSLAFGIIIGGVFLVAAAVVFSLFLTPWNIAFIPVFNGLIDGGMPTQQTADTFHLYRDASVAVPVFVLFALLLWAWIRGLEARN